MKLIKNTQFGEINTSIDGVLYCITQDGIEVSDETAAKMSEQFLHTVSISDIEVPVEVTVAPIEEIAPVEVSIEQSPVVEPNLE